MNKSFLRFSLPLLFKLLVKTSEKQDLLGNERLVLEAVRRDDSVEMIQTCEGGASCDKIKDLNGII